MVDSVKPIRTALRTVAILAELNTCAPASAAEVARRLGLARATTYRFLETLVDAGYVAKEAAGRYMPTHQVRSLSCGFEDESWLVECARPVIQALGEKLVWPIAIATISGTGMLLRESTDKDSPLAINRFTPGRRISLVGTASGRVYLAYCAAEQRDTLLDILRRSNDPDDLDARNRPGLGRELAEIRQRSYATVNRTRRVSNQSAIAVPVLTSGDNRILASLSIRYSETAVMENVALQKFLAPLQAAALEIGDSFSRSMNEDAEESTVTTSVE
jgi:IclR family mhp operon transcriptional activator